MIQVPPKSREYSLEIIGLSERIRKNPWDARIRFERGNVHRRRYGLAILDFKVALALDPSFAEAYFYKAVCCARLGYTLDEVKAYEQFLTHAGESLTPYFEPIKRRIAHLRSRGQSNKQVKLFRRRPLRAGVR